MAIDGIQGGKSQDIQKADRSAVDAKRPANTAKTGEESTPKTDSAQVSDKSRAAVKAYRIASETKPDISRAARVAQIKSEVIDGTYKPASADVADAIIKSVIKES